MCRITRGNAQDLPDGRAQPHKAPTRRRRRTFWNLKPPSPKMPPMSEPLPHTLPSTYLGNPPKLLRLGGGLGMAGSCVGIAVLLLACGGISMALVMSFIPLILGAVGFVLSLVGANTEKRQIGKDDTHVMGALFICCMAIIGGLVEMAAWRGWMLFHG